MLNFNFLEKRLGRVSPPHFVYDFQKKYFCHNLLTDQILWSNCLYLRYWAIYVLQLLVNQAAMP